MEKITNVLNDLLDPSVDLDYIASCIPGTLHINRLSDFKPIYIDPVSLRSMGLILDDEEPSTYKVIKGLEVVHPDDLEHAIKVTQHYLDHLDEYSTISFTQRIYHKKDKRFYPYYTTSKLIESRGGLVSFSIPIGEIALTNSSVDKLLYETDFIKKNIKRFATLSLREREFITNWIQLHDNSLIANEMNVTPNTVKSYKKRIYKKLEINKYVQLYDYAQAFQLIDK